MRYVEDGKPYAIFDAQRLWKQSVICTYTDIAKGEEIDPEMMNGFVYDTPIYDMLVGANGYEPAINMEQYRDLRETVENTLRLWLCCVEKEAQASEENVKE